jgi:ATP-dependent DNA helicase RecQ
MTRAQETLTLLELHDGHHPHLPLLDGDWLLRTRPAIEPPEPAVVMRRYTRLTPADLDLGYAGRQPPSAPIHRHLAALQPGDLLDWRQDAAQLLLVDPPGHPVARLSKRAAAAWLPRIGGVEQIRVEALLRRDRGQGKPEHAGRSLCERWEVPLVEICWHVH